MRNIKFRCYDTKENKWLFGYEYSNLGGFNLWGECVLLGELSSIPLEKLNDISTMQYTGLKDKNGKEIYEGDIVSFKRPVGNWTGKGMTSAHKIYFEEHICAFVMEAPGDYIKLRNGRTYVYEVLGNIYENDFEKIKLAVEAVTPNMNHF